MSEPTIADGNWLAGLVDGEGCFFLSTSRMRYARGYSRPYRCLVFEFKIALRADDIAALRLARSILETGTLRVFRRSINASTPTNAKPIVRLLVCGRADIPRVIAFFRHFPLRSKKARDFRLWAEAFEKFQAALDNTPLTWVSKNVLPRLASGRRRPSIGTRRTRFRTIPDELWAEMDRYAQDIDNTRRFAVVP